MKITNKLNLPQPFKVFLCIWLFYFFVLQLCQVYLLKFLYEGLDIRTI